MTETIETAMTVTTADAEYLVEFFSSGQLLKQACEESCIDYNAARRNLNGPAQNVRLLYVVRLKKWALLWTSQKTEREELVRGA